MSHNTITLLLAKYYVMCSRSHVQNTPQPHRQSTKLNIVTSSMRTKVLIKFQTSEMVLKIVELRAKKVQKCVPFAIDIRCACIWEVLKLIIYVQNTPHQH